MVRTLGGRSYLLPKQDLWLTANLRADGPCPQRRLAGVSQNPFPDSLWGRAGLHPSQQGQCLGHLSVLVLVTARISLQLDSCFKLRE